MFFRRILSAFFVLVTLLASASSLGLNLHIAFHDHHEKFERVGLIFLFEHSHEENGEHQHREVIEELGSFDRSLNIVFGEVALYSISKNEDLNFKVSQISILSPRSFDKYNSFSPHRYRNLPLLN